MERFVPVRKLSKKERRKRELAKRRTWGAVSPVTRKPENPKAYRRSKMRKIESEQDDV